MCSICGCAPCPPWTSRPEQPPAVVEELPREDPGNFLPCVMKQAFGLYFRSRTGSGRWGEENFAPISTRPWPWRRSLSESARFDGREAPRGKNVLRSTIEKTGGTRLAGSLCQLIKKWRLKEDGREHALQEKPIRVSLVFNQRDLSGRSRVLLFDFQNPSVDKTGKRARR